MNQVMETTRPSAVEVSAERPPGRARPDWQRVSLGLGGLMFAVGNLLHPLEHNDDAYHSTTWKAAHLTIFFSIPLLVLGLPVLHRLLVERVGRRLSTFAVAASVAGLIGIAPGTVIEAFVAPVIGHEAMEELESGGMGAASAILAIAYLSGTLCLGWAVTRSKLRPRWAGPALAGGAIVLLGVMSATGPIAGVVIISATALYGLSLSALAIRAR